VPTAFADQRVERISDRGCKRPYQDGKVVDGCAAEEPTLLVVGRHTSGCCLSDLAHHVEGNSATQRHVPRGDERVDLSG
jgi:hypothetical protein